MRPVRLRARRRVSGRPFAPGLILAIGVVASFVVNAAKAGEPRVLPAYATQPAGASFEGYPAIGLRQKVQIGQEVVTASIKRLLQAPLRSSAHIVGREGERLTVRAREMATTVRLPAHLRDTDSTTCELGGGYGGLPTPARVTLLPSSEASIQSLLALISNARVRIDLMMYGWEDDPTGREIAAALAQAGQRGVVVRALSDRTAFLIHNANAASKARTFLDALAEAPNVRVLQTDGAFVRFDHRKLAVIDGRVAWAGSMIFTEVARRRWHNIAVLVEGPVVAQLECVFEERWRDVGGTHDAPVANAASESDGTPNAMVRLIQTNDNDRSLKDTIYHAVDNAKWHIYLENPYFSDDILTAKLVDARKRGVDVRAVLTMRGNVERLNRYANVTANRLLRAGARVYLYPAMTHVKAMTADGVWAYVGSGNFDELSLRNNREVGLSVSSAAFVGQLEAQLVLADMAVSEELDALLPTPRHRLLMELMDIWY